MGPLQRLRQRLSPSRATRGRSFSELSPEEAIRLGYNLVLGREPDRGGTQYWLSRLRSGELSHDRFAESLRASEEYFTRAGFTMLDQSLHRSRCQFIRGLPPARRILDLGGTHQAKDEGAFVAMGYPYRFEELVVVDLPDEERHELYRAAARPERVESVRGPVRYRYHSMTDLSGYASGSFDLVYMGQSIEHVRAEDADHVLEECGRLLRPRGYLALDTPNARATRLQQDALIDPDHEVEYTHAEMTAKLVNAGFEVVEAKGLNYLGDAVAEGAFSEPETAAHAGLYAAIEDCYLLAYVCRNLSS
jgi:SAM-dependent methyltransferase